MGNKINTANDEANNRPVMTPQQFSVLGGGRIAYVKSIRSEDVHSLYPQAPEMEAGQKLFALHAADGTPIAIMDNWASAYGAAVQNDFVPVSVH